MYQRIEDETVKTMRRNPRLVAHLICESLGYFTPKAAAAAIIHYRRDESFPCEWFSHMAQFVDGSTGIFDNKALLKVARDTMRSTIRNRKYHKGYMSDYGYAKSIVAHSIGGNDPLFASWF